MPVSTPELSKSAPGAPSTTARSRRPRTKAFSGADKQANAPADEKFYTVEQVAEDLNVLPALFAVGSRAKHSWPTASAFPCGSPRANAKPLSPDTAARSAVISSHRNYGTLVGLPMSTYFCSVSRPE